MKNKTRRKIFLERKQQDVEALKSVNSLGWVDIFFSFSLLGFIRTCCYHFHLCGLFRSLIALLREGVVCYRLDSCQTTRVAQVALVISSENVPIYENKEKMLLRLPYAVAFPFFTGIQQ